MMIRYKKQITLSKKFLRRGTPLSRSHVLSMTGRCTYPIYYQRVASVDKGSVIIRYQKQISLSKKAP